ncbi:calpain clp-1-like [Macrosteles quadrilineatus]|uniref:calpain clp-1-like n=1 Tax=Macrosteles quadrilineatus TaxID=74068 RepID=UPI0023E2048B|nr:calpain clp-1-like [Macrosteles quadrilineatus]
MQQNTDQPVYKLHNQDFKYIRDWLLQRGYIFNDPHFKLNKEYEWLRPSKITEEPQLFVGETTQHDVMQVPSVGYCYLIAAMSALAFHPELVKQVVPSDQSFYDKYAGIFHFRFWRFGRWYDVVVDDRLPTLKGKLALMKSPTNAFWPALLLKAYFKFLYGAYQDVEEGGNSFVVMQDFTGGIVQEISLNNLPETFEKTLLKAIARKSLVCCGIYGEAKSHLGLVSNHAYTITGARTVSVPGRGEVLLIRIRNPWGYFEWKGAWSDGSREWELVPKDLKEELAVVNRNEGEFVMEFSDFKSNFEHVDICYLSPNVYLNAYGQNSEVGLWHLDMVKGSWIKGVTAGGLESLHDNPQIRFRLNEADGDNDGECSVLIALLIKHRAAVLGFKVYRISDLNQPALDHYFLKKQPTSWIRFLTP